MTAPPTWVRFALAALFLALSGPTIYEKLYPLKLFVTNHPSRLNTINTFPKHKIIFENDLRNCEDIAIDEDEQILIMSCDPGRDLWNTVMGTFISSTDLTGWLYYYRYAEAGSTFHPFKITSLPVIKKENFHPLGIGYHAPSKTLYVSNHGHPGAAMDRFIISEDFTTLTYGSTVHNELMKTPNSILPWSDHEVLFTNDHGYVKADQPYMAEVETYLGLPLGSVVYLNLKTGESKIMTKLHYANGIARLNDTHIAVASTGGLAVYIFEVQSDFTLTQKLKIPCNVWVDNLKVDSAGMLLIGGHPHAPSVQAVATNQHKYDLDPGHVRTAGGADGKGGGLLALKDRPRAPSWLAEWDGNTEGRINLLYVENEYGSSCSAVRDVKQKVGFLAGLYDRGLLQWWE